MTKRRQPIPYKITHGIHRPLIFVEAWFREPQGPDGTGYVRTFEARDFARAGAYVMELQAGHVSGRY